MTDQNKNPNLAELSDEEINNLDPTTLAPEEQTSVTEETQEQTETATSTEVEDNDSDSTGGAESEDDSSSDDESSAASTSADEDEGTDTETQTEEDDEQTSEDDQSTDDGSEADSATADSTGDVDPKAELAKVMAPFKAAKREIKINSVEDARRLMQMGVDYARKMEAMKPYRRVLKTLEKAGLVDVDKINFLIDLERKDPEAIRKFLKDSQVDPLDINLEDDSNYKPTDHMVGDNEIALDDVIDDIRGTPSFDKTVDVITNQWDKASKELLMDNPAVIRIINDHVDAGIFDMIADRVASEKVLGKLSGLSDLEAYKAVGDAMHTNGEFAPNGNASKPSGNTNQGHSQDSGSSSSKEENLRNRKRAASPTKGNASTRKKAPDWGKLSDEQIESFDINSL